MTLDNNNKVLAEFDTFFSLYNLPHTSVGLTSCISIVFFCLKNVDPSDHYAVCCVPFPLLHYALGPM